MPAGMIHQKQPGVYILSKTARGSTMVTIWAGVGEEKGGGG